MFVLVKTEAQFRSQVKTVSESDIWTES